MKEIKVEVVKLTVSTKAELTCKLLTEEVMDGYRLSNQAITDKVAEAFGDASINCVRWYASKIRKGHYVEQYGLDASKLNLTALPNKKS